MKKIKAYVEWKYRWIKFRCSELLHVNSKKLYTARSAAKEAYYNYTSI